MSDIEQCFLKLLSEPIQLIVVIAAAYSTCPLFKNKYPMTIYLLWVTPNLFYTCISMVIVAPSPAVLHLVSIFRSMTHLQSMLWGTAARCQEERGKKLSFPATHVWKFAVWDIWSDVMMFQSQKQNNPFLVFVHFTDERHKRWNKSALLVIVDYQKSSSINSFSFTPVCARSLLTKI